MSEARLPFPLPHALAPLHVRRDGRDGRDGRSDADTAPTLVLLHAICTSGALWTPQLDAWRPAFRLLCVDLPGHGESAPLAGDATLADVADALAATLDAHGESRVTLVGTSWGSMVAQAFALRHPSRTASLVLAHAGSTTSAEGAALWERRLSDYDAAPVEQHVRATVDRWLSPVVAQASPTTTRWLEGLVRSTSREGYRQAVRTIQRLDHLAVLSAIECPALVIAGAADRAVPLAAVRTVAATLPAADFVALDTGHMSNVEQPATFAALVSGFVRAAPR